MAFQLEHLHRAFAAENELAFTAWAYATRDPLAAVAAKGYFHGCRRQLTVGDLIFCAAEQPEPRAPAEAGRERRRCLLLVTRMGWDGIETRVAQDWGTADAPAAPGAGDTLAAPEATPGAGDTLTAPEATPGPWSAPEARGPRSAPEATPPRSAPHAGLPRSVRAGRLQRAAQSAGHFGAARQPARVGVAARGRATAPRGVPAYRRPLRPGRRA